MSPIFSRRLLLLSLGLVPTLAVSGVYKCLDQNGKTFYQDKPCQELTSAGLSPALAKLAPDENRPHLLWKLSSGEKNVFLLGSVGYGTSDMYPLPESLMDAFTGSNVLVIANEIDAGGDAAAKKAEVVAKGSYSDGSTLQSHVKPATWQRVLDLAKTLNISEETISSQRPWMAALTLKSAALKQAGFDDKLSIDKTFIKAAETLKPVIEIDSFENQVKLYEQMPDAEQEQILLRAIYEADNKNEYFKLLIDAWKKGDADSVDITVRRVLDSLPKSEKSWEDKRNARNEAIADKISEMAADGRIYFIIVDAKQVAGEKGILALLQAKGFKASQL
jgi:uncharacterized protein YbaP (TraB family)